jgi:hypothetical protein
MDGQRVRTYRWWEMIVAAISSPTVGSTASTRIFHAFLDARTRLAAESVRAISNPGVGSSCLLGWDAWFLGWITDALCFLGYLFSFNGRALQGMDEL